jgi:hypothetical protein
MTLRRHGPRQRGGIHLKTRVRGSALAIVLREESALSLSCPSILANLNCMPASITTTVLTGERCTS